MFQPLPGPGEDFMRSTAHIQLCTRSNRGGKTVHVAYKVAQIFRGKGEQWGFPRKNGTILVVGMDWSHISAPMWIKLAWPGAFQIVRDEVTDKWRSVRVNPNEPTELDPIDVERKQQWRPAPPFLPPDEIEISWHRRNLNEPKRVVHKASGWEMIWFSSEGHERKGIDVDLVWFDEEILREAWVPEALARLIDRNGKLFWSFTPEGSTQQGYEFHKKAESGDPTVEEFPFYIYNNPYLPQEAKDEFYNSLDPEIRRIKWYGEYAITARRVYPEFSPMKEHFSPNFEIPHDWMRVFAVDPGFQCCAILYGAVPPPPKDKEQPHWGRSWPQLHLYAEDYIRPSHCELFGQKLRQRTTSSMWEVGLFDKKYGQQSQDTSGRTRVAHYEDELKKRNIATRRMGKAFLYGSAEVDSRTEATKAFLSKRHCIKVHQGCCPKLCLEMDSEYYKKDNPDKRDIRNYGHLVWCLEAICAYFDLRQGIYWDKPEKHVIVEGSPAYRSFKAKQKRLRNVRRHNRLYT